MKFLLSPFMQTKTVTNYSEVQDALSFPNVVDMEIVRLQNNIAALQAQPNNTWFSSRNEI